METLNNYTTFVLIVMIVFTVKHIVNTYNKKLEHKSFPRMSVNGMLQDALIKASMSAMSVLIAGGIYYLMQKVQPDLIYVIALAGIVYIYCIATDMLMDVVIKPSDKARKAMSIVIDLSIAVFCGLSYMLESKLHERLFTCLNS